MENNQITKNKVTKYSSCMSQVDNQLLIKWQSEQNLLKCKLIEEDDLDFSLSDPSKIIRVAGMDISASKDDPDIAVVGLVICNFFENFKILYQKFEFVKISQPYVPGFLAFREIDHLIKLLDELKLTEPNLMPHLILIDGNGILHSNGFGLACHLGVLSDIPTIGCGKTVFNVDGIDKKSVKEQARNLSNAGDFFYLKGLSGRIWGAALKCTEQSIDPMIISIGHKISLDTALDIVKKTCLFRVPEPIRLADKITRKIIKEFELKKCSFDINAFLKINDP